MKRKSIALALALCLIFAFAGCSQTGTPSAEPDTPTGSAEPAVPSSEALTEEEALYKAALEEGGVVRWQVTADVSGFQHLIDAFMDRYPGITVEAFNVQSQTFVSQIINESAAKNLSADVATVQTTEFLDLLSSGLAETVDWKAIFDVSDDLILYDGAMIRAYDNTPFFIYNKDMIDIADIPTDIDGLLKEEWAGGKFAVSSSGLFAAYLFDEYQADPDAALDKVQQLLDQDPIIVGSGVQIVESVSNGEYAIGWAPGPSAISAIEAGANIGICPFGTTYNASVGVFVIKDCPNMSAAKLLAGWLGSAEAREVWASGAFNIADEGATKEALESSGLTFVCLATQQECTELLSFTNKVSTLITGLG